MNHAPEASVPDDEEERLRRHLNAEKRSIAQHDALIATLKADIAPKNDCIAEQQAFIHQLGVNLDKIEAQLQQCNYELCERHGTSERSILRRAQRDYVMNKLDAIIAESFAKSTPPKPKHDD